MEVFGISRKRLWLRVRYSRFGRAKMAAGTTSSKFCEVPAPKLGCSEELAGELPEVIVYKLECYHPWRNGVRPGRMEKSQLQLAPVYLFAAHIKVSPQQ